MSSVVTSRIYGITVIGEYALAMAAVGAVRLLSTTKERPALVRELTALDPRHPRVTGLFVATLSFSAALTLMIGALALLATSLLLSGPISRPSLFPAAAANVAGYVFIGNTGENIDVVFNGFRAGRQTFWVRLFTAIAFLVIAVPLGIEYGTVWGLIAANVGSQATGLLHRVFLIRRFMRFSASKQVIREGFRTLPGLVRFGLKITPGALADGVSDESGTWIVASFRSVADVGAYGRAYSLVRQLSVLNVRTNEMLFPTLIERRAKQDGPGYARALVDSLRYTTIALLLPAAACGGVAQGVMRLFGPGFDRGSDALAILVLIPPLAALSQIQRLALYSLDRPLLASISGLLRLVTTITAGVLLTWQLGAAGAALALVIGFLVDLGFSMRIVARNLTTPLRELWPLRQRLALAAAFASGFAAAHIVYASLSSLAGLLGGGAVGAITFLALLFIGGAVNERDWERYRDARRMFARRRARAAHAS